jgi:hypothetical protein
VGEIVHFFCSSKRTEQKKKHNFRTNFTSASSPKANEPKKRRPEMPTSVKMGACYTGLSSTILPEVRTISGIALAPPFIKLSNIIIIFGFLMASENFGK